jgi:hypothetical protein
MKLCKIISFLLVLFSIHASYSASLQGQVVTLQRVELALQEQNIEFAKKLNAMQQQCNNDSTALSVIATNATAAVIAGSIGLALTAPSYGCQSFDEQKNIFRQNEAKATEVALMISHIKQLIHQEERRHVQNSRD